MARQRKQFGTADDTELAFYDAIARADLDALMALWAEDEEIVCIHPDGTRLIGYAAIRASWAEIFTRGGVHIRPSQLHASQNVMSAVHNLVESVSLPEGRERDIHILATNVYVKTPLGWRIVVHHASVAPGKAEPELATGNVLH
ncbi:MAG TPA: nuclear transport factor 2 family protein [Oxalicibacterium sp.]|jgi:ketosteroid isomerase-like protein|nr:nuclear transport factor 2 family protein [Oxalicibacterium sp.]